MVAEALQSSQSAQLDSSSGDSDAADAGGHSPCASSPSLDSPQETQWEQAYHSRYAELLETKEAQVQTAEAAARRLRGERQSIASLELGELVALESELWQALQRVSCAKTDAMHAGFERRLQARLRSLARCLRNEAGVARV